ncbi:substrate-binding domain-containing protein [Paraburkholderia phymatum]|uniref:ABC molybdate transporter, periplasmic ligand binding protein n=1 Tax=Paraburkholderia phymatum (strain DSM 17167 / CIP 108236 / LMG 21445 / STM815) TaxID=391038 RepID=B2JWS7_PARP8|nr:substrate-binding domain-containing protein [Paraburkholderia phymatum]ACC75404.1 ABC molybdate transporter, periplasmic ligand binding protein [Paraburkholderia phymatum STM815]
MVGAEASRPLTVVSSMATRQMLADLVDVYRRETGEQAEVQSMGGVDAAQRVLEGQPYDVVVLAADAIVRLAVAGRIDPRSRVDLVRSGIAVAVRAGATVPALGNGAAVRRAVMSARSVGYSTGPSGAYVLKLFEGWGIGAGASTPRVVQAPPGVPVGSLVASGEVDIGFQQLSELMHMDGITVAGLLPPDIQSTTVFSAAICCTAQRQDSARALIAFLASPAANDAKLRQGMEPA